MKHCKVNAMKGIFLTVVVALLWSVVPIALKVALHYFDPYTIVWFRFLFAAFVLVIYYAFSKPSLLNVYRHPPKMMIYGAVLLAGSYITYMQGVHYAGPGIAQIIMQAGPVILGITGVTVFGERLTITPPIKHLKIHLA